MSEGLDLLKEVLQERIEKKRREDMSKNKPAQIRVTENGKEKWCPKGKHYVKADEDHFYQDKKSKTKLSSWCRKCQRQNIKSPSSISEAVPVKTRKKEEKKDRVLKLDFSDYDMWYDDLLSEADDNLRTPEMQAMWLISESLYKERA